MKIQPFKQEFSKMIAWFTNETMVPSSLKLDFDVYKNIWNFLLVGDSYYWVLNHHTLQCDIVSNEVEDILGYKPSEFDIYFITEQMHPDDLTYFFGFGKKSTEFLSQLSIERVMKYKIRYDVRYKKKTGDYARILYQGILIEHDDNGGLLRSLAIHTDITYLKKEGKPSLSFIGTDGEPSYIDVDLGNDFLNKKDDLTSREKEVLKLLIEGKVSKQIGSILKITKQTVDTHRKNMLHKKHLKNTSELVSKAITCGWI